MVGHRLGLVVLLSLGSLLACTSDPTSPSRGTANVYLTDAPIDFTGVSAVNVTLTEIVVFGGEDSGEEAEAMDMPLGAGMTVNLLDLQNGRTLLVAIADLAPGDYGRIRLGIESAELVRDDDGDPATPEITEPIFVPSSKVDVPVAFGVTSGETTDVTLDFDAALSVQVNSTPGQEPYILRPVITPVGVTRH